MSQTELNEASNGFWEIGNYKANVQRIHQGSEQLEDIARFIKDRIAIENNYSKHLERWNDEWRNYSDKYLREGSVKSSFDLLLEESQELTKVHQAVKERFNDEVLKTIELFKRDNYHKSTFRGFKEAKEIEDEFEKAQKQWKKLFEKVEATKRNYHALARAEKSAYIQFMNSKADQSIADTASEKCKERFDKCQEELKKAKNNYEVQVREITAYNNIYMENMAFVFEKCQRMEMKRIRFVVEMFSGMQKILVDLLNPPKLVQLHTKLRQHFLDINDATIGEDMKRWSLKHGVDSNTKWPQFEEYSSEFRHIHSGSSKAKQRQRQQLEAANAVVLTKKVSRNEDNGPATVASVNGTEQRQHQQQQNGRGSRFSRSSSQQPSREWTGTASSQNSVGSGSAVVDGEEEPGMELAVDNRNSSNGDHLAKQNSIGSQQSRATSKSSRSQSEKPPPPTSDGNQIQQQLPLQDRVQGGQRMDRQQLATTAAAIGGGSRHQPRVAGIKMISNHQPPQQQQQQQRPVSSNSASLNDPLAVNSFPMVTPQKSEKVDEVGGEGKARAGTVPQSASDFFRKNGKCQQPNPRSAEESAHEQQEQTEQIDLDQLPPPMPVGPARALYDYEPREDDEIHLTKGEVLDVLHGPDHLGWCMGVRTNKERGLFPALYVSPLIQSADQ